MHFRFICLCPTYGRTASLLNATLACFHSQILFGGDTAVLVLYDDLGTLAETTIRDGGKDPNKSLLLYSSTEREPGLIGKYNSMLRFADENLQLKDSDVLVLWDDDDLYLYDHLAEMRRFYDIGCEYTYPAVVGSTYRPNLIEETGGRFWASLSVSYRFFKEVGGFVNTPRADFDQQFVSRLLNSRGLRGIPELLTYIFRWADTSNTHSQGAMHSPDDTGWYQRNAPLSTTPIDELVPRFDNKEEAVIRNYRLIRQKENHVRT